MRKALLLIVLLLVIAGGLAAIVVYRWTRKPTPTPVGWRAHVTTIAGNGSPLFKQFSSEQPTRISFSDPFGVAVAKDGTIYIADAGETNRIFKITEGTITPVAGSHEADSDDSHASASFNTPSGLAIDGDGNIYVADTGNNRIRKVTPDSQVSTVAGDGTAGYLDGPAKQARFNGPVGVAVDAKGNIFVADTYNDRIRKISSDGQVSTVSGGPTPGLADDSAALFDTPCGVVVTPDGTLIVADTGNDLLRKINPDGNVSTWDVKVNGESLSNPVGLALTYDNYLYVTELDRARVIQVAPDGTASVIAGRGPGFADTTDDARFNQPAGVAIDPNSGELYVADSANYLIRKLDPKTPSAGAASAVSTVVAPQLSNVTLEQQSLIWPVDPQESPHEVVATIGEVRGSFDSNDSRHHLHSGLDVFGAYNSTVRAVRSEKVTSPLPNWAFGSINEGIRVGVISYIHIHVGRDKDGKMFDDDRFLPVNGADGKLARVRVKRGTRFKPRDAMGTVNRMYHVHMNVGPPGAEINPLTLSPVGFKDDVVPTIEKDGIQLFDQSGPKFSEKVNNRLVVTGKVRIIVDAFDRTNFNSDRRRLGLYILGYQILKADGSAAPGFAEPRITQIYDRLPPGRESTKVAYAEQSGITVYGSETTKFLYEVTNWVRDSRANRDVLDTSKLPPGDYILRIIARDYNGNEAQDGRDLLITVR